MNRPRWTLTRDGFVRVPVTFGDWVELAWPIWTSRVTTCVVLAAGLGLFATGLVINSTNVVIAGAVLLLLAAMRLHYLATQARARRTHRYLRCRCPGDRHGDAS